MISLPRFFIYLFFTGSSSRGKGGEKARTPARDVLGHDEPVLGV